MQAAEPRLLMFDARRREKERFVAEAVFMAGWLC
jgi:hypothetical protein